MTKKTPLLQEVCLIRILLIILLIVYHSFAPFGYRWKPFYEMEENKFYWWIAEFAYSFMLECFVFISGYIYGYQTIHHGKNIISTKNIFEKKLKRLLIPSITFSIIYLVVFGLIENENIYKACYSILEGRGHMWFLPMLFWCFVGIWIINKSHNSSKWQITIILLLSVLPLGMFPFRLGVAFKYFFFFYLGYLLQCTYPIINRLTTKKNIFVFFFIYLITFAFTCYIKFKSNSQTPIFFDGNTFLLKLINILIINGLNLIYSTFGIMTILLLANWIINYKRISLPYTLIKLSSYCFGVYIFQQFILQYIYYHTSLPLIFTSDLVPWVGTFITFSISLLFTYLILKTSIGRYLLG